MKSTTNVFSKGLTTDLHPLTVSKEQLTDALNATFITYNGNELVLQNDMGNTKIQDRVTGSIMGLKEGFIPMGMKEHGGVLYIASYNPSTKTSELGSIPSPLFDYTHEEYTSSILQVELFNVDSFTTNSNPVVLDSNHLFSVGDKIVCGLDIDGQNQVLKRSDYNNVIFSYPIISTRAQSGLVTLHAVATPCNTMSEIDLQQHTFKYGEQQQWFYDLQKGGHTQDSNKIIYPNFSSGQLAIKPVLQKIENIRVIQNSTTLRNEPYHTKKMGIVIDIQYIARKLIKEIAHLPYTSGGAMGVVNTFVQIENRSIQIEWEEPALQKTKSINIKSGESLQVFIPETEVTIRLNVLGGSALTKRDVRHISFNDSQISIESTGFTCSESGVFKVQDIIDFKEPTDDIPVQI